MQTNYDAELWFADEGRHGSWYFVSYFRVFSSSDGFPYFVAPAFSTPAVCSCIFHSCIFHSRIFSAPVSPSPPYPEADYRIMGSKTLVCISAMLWQNFQLLSRRSRQRERLSASVLSICVCPFVCLSPKCKKNVIFSKKLSNLDLWSLLTTYRNSHMGFLKNPLVDP